MDEDEDTLTTIRRFRNMKINQHNGLLGLNFGSVLSPCLPTSGGQTHVLTLCKHERPSAGSSPNLP